MKLSPIKFGLAGVLSTAIIWIVCSAFITFTPDMMWCMTEHVTHMNFEGLGQDQDTNWTLTTTGFFSGMFLWCLTIGVFLWLFAIIYNYVD
jgi:predicted PurR-regulated permease PerM